MPDPLESVLQEDQNGKKVRDVKCLHTCKKPSEINCTFLNIRVTMTCECMVTYSTFLCSKNMAF